MDPAVEHILRLREQPATRAQLRRALNPATRRYAFPYLARWWAARPFLKEPLLLTAGLTATFPKIPQGDASLGQLLAEAVRQGKASEGNVERKLVALVGGSLQHAGPMLRSLLANAETAGALDWGSVFDAARLWEHPDITVRRRVRERILEDFYTTLTPAHDRNPEATTEGAQ